MTRIPTNERTGRRHTSAVTVAVLPVPPSASEAISERDVRITTFKGTGPGGQHRNKTENCVRALHVPTGITAQATSERSQIVNRERALETLAARVAEARRSSATAAIDRTRRKHHGSGHIAERARSYLWREGVAVDHTSGVRVPLTQALDGNLAPFAERVLTPAGLTR